MSKVHSAGLQLANDGNLFIAPSEQIANNFSKVKLISFDTQNSVLNFKNQSTNIAGSIYTTTTGPFGDQIFIGGKIFDQTVKMWFPAFANLSTSLTFYTIGFENVGLNSCTEGG